MKVLAFYGTSVPFDNWDISKTKEFGYHFAVENDRASRHRIEKTGGKIYSVEISYSNPLRMKDAHYWDLQSILSALMQGSRYPELKKLAAMNARKNFSSLRVEENLIAAKILDEAGYDAIEYANEGESGGDAIIIWHPEQIRKLNKESLKREMIMRLTESQIRKIVRNEVLKRKMLEEGA